MRKIQNFLSLTVHFRDIYVCKYSWHRHARGINAWMAHLATNSVRILKITNQNGLRRVFSGFAAQQRSIPYPETTLPDKRCPSAIFEASRSDPESLAGNVGCFGSGAGANYRAGNFHSFPGPLGAIPFWREKSVVTQRSRSSFFIGSAWVAPLLFLGLRQLFGVLAYCVFNQ